jgi:RNA polymerase sigma-70 factor (family 1)
MPPPVYTFTTQIDLTLTVSTHDTRLANAITLDDTEAFDTLYHKYYNAVFANIFKLVRHHESAEDILQDVFVSLWENRKNIDTERSIGGWLFVVSHNKALKFINKAVREKLQALEDSAFSMATPENESIYLEYQSSLINEAIDNLPPQKRLVFTLCKLEGKTYEQAALEAGISPHTVKEYVGAASKFVKAYFLRHYALHAPLPVSVLFIVLNHL